MNAVDIKNEIEIARATKSAAFFKNLLPQNKNNFTDRIFY